MSTESLEAGYQRWFIADAYDLLARAVFAPLGGLSLLRRAALSHCNVTSGERVLELGCGSGGVTQLLCERGAHVTAVDWSSPMLSKAARRAPQAQFVRSEITSFEPAAGGFDVVLLCFVLHELDSAARAQALQVAVRALGPRGRLALVDHALPERGSVAHLMSFVVHRFEPPTSQGFWLAPGGAESELADAGFTAGARLPLAGGMAFALEARPLGRCR